MFLVSSCSCLCPIHWSQVLSREWRCSWNSADRRCSNYIWMIDNLIAYKGASYIRDLTVVLYRVGSWAEIISRCSAPLWGHLNGLPIISKHILWGFSLLAPWGRDKMAAVSQTILSNAFSWMKMLEFWLRFHWSLFLRVQLTIFQHWFR